MASNSIPSSVTVPVWPYCHTPPHPAPISEASIAAASLRNVSSISMKLNMTSRSNRSKQREKAKRKRGREGRLPPKVRTATAVAGSRRDSSSHLAASQLQTCKNWGGGGLWVRAQSLLLNLEGLQRSSALAKKRLQPWLLAPTPKAGLEVELLCRPCPKSAPFPEARSLPKP